MNVSTKDIVRVSLIILLLSAAYGILSFARSYANAIDPSSVRNFTVSGRGETVAVPDVAQFTFSVITQGGTNLGNLQQQNVQKTNGAITFVKSQGVDAKDIKTTGYSVSPRYQYYDCGRVLPVKGGEFPKPCPPPEIVGYAVSQTVQVKARDFEKVGAIVAGVVDNGANEVSQLSFTVDDPLVFESQARAEAIAKAKEKADAIAQAGGFKIGKLISISEGYAPLPLYAYGKGGAVETMSADAVVLEFEPGSEEITVTVTLTFEIR